MVSHYIRADTHSTTQWPFGACAVSVDLIVLRHRENKCPAVNWHSVRQRCGVTWNLDSSELMQCNVGPAIKPLCCHVHCVGYALLLSGFRLVYSLLGHFFALNILTIIIESVDPHRSRTVFRLEIRSKVTLHTAERLDWIEQCFASPPTEYRLYGRRFYRSKDPTNSIKVLKE